ncbi:MAG: HipA family kinase [Aureliella sp.]
MRQANFSEWSGKIANRDNGHDVILTGVLQEAKSCSKPFRATASDGKQYWVKVVDQSSVGRLAVTELIVGACGRLIGAPVCDSTRVAIPEQLEGVALASGRVLHAGIAHGSLHLENSFEQKAVYPSYRRNDDNRRRHAGYYALYDWCWGADPQWLHQASKDYATFSHDHGLFLPAPWTRAAWEPLVSEPHEFWADCRGFDDNEFERLANALEAVSQQTIVGILQTVPESWPVTDEELAVIGCFLFHRAGTAAERVRRLAEQV